MFDFFKKLFVPFKDALKKTKGKGGQKITFVEWPQYVQRAWKEFPEGFSKTVTEIKGAGSIWSRVEDDGGETQVDDRQLIIVVRVTDIATGAYQDATGVAPMAKNKETWGGAAAEAESQALRRAFACFGLGLEMYMDEAQKKNATTTDPTKDQIARLKSLAKQIEDEDNETLTEALVLARAQVREAEDKEFAANMQIEMVEKAMAEEGVTPIPF